MHRGRALIIATSKYDRDPELTPLPSVVEDAAGLEAVLGDPRIGNFAVATCLESLAQECREQVEDFFQEATRDDLLLLYITGHGVKDAEGELYFAVCDTRTNRLPATGIASSFIKGAMRRSKARGIVTILDTCFSGAFAGGSPMGVQVGVADHFRESRGRVVITASDSFQHALGGHIPGEPVRPSLFSGHVIHGLKTGDADLNGNGEVSTTDLFNYVCAQLELAGSGQRPQRWDFKRDGPDLVLATTPGPLPAIRPEDPGFAPPLPLWSDKDATAGWSVRESTTATRLTVRVFHTGRVEVVVPSRTSPRAVERFLERHRSWIERKRDEARQKAVPPAPFPPQRIELAACQETWAIQLTAGNGRLQLTRTAPGVLTLEGDRHNGHSVRMLLRHWLTERAREVLTPQLSIVARELGFSYQRILIRRQRTRWGSCSNSGTIILNCCLLFQRAAVVRYLLVHQLVHTLHMNHSRRFWQRVERHCPDYQSLDRELGEGWRRVPAWVFGEEPGAPEPPP